MGEKEENSEKFDASESEYQTNKMKTKGKKNEIIVKQEPGSTDTKSLK